jgi:hypothetical protein
MKQSKNVEGILDWYRKNRPDMLAHIEGIFPLPVGERPTPAEIADERNMEPLQALLLQGFEAGRMFEKEHPNVESGIGYLND